MKKAGQLAHLKSEDDQDKPGRGGSRSKADFLFVVAADATRDIYPVGAVFTLVLGGVGVGLAISALAATVVVGVSRGVFVSARDRGRDRSHRPLD